MIDDKDAKSEAFCSDNNISQLTRDYRELSYLSEKSGAGAKEELKEHLSKLSSDTGVSRAELLNSYHLEVNCNGNIEVIGRKSVQANNELDPEEVKHLPTGEPVKDVYVGLIPSFDKVFKQGSSRTNNLSLTESFSVASGNYVRRKAEELNLQVENLAKEMSWNKIAEESGLSKEELALMRKENPDLENGLGQVFNNFVQDFMPAARQELLSLANSPVRFTLNASSSPRTVEGE